MVSLLMSERLTRTLQAALNLKLTPAQLQAFEVYTEELLTWNARINLTAITELEDIATRHFADSLSCLPIIKPRPPGLRVVDVGTGAGFPGLPLRIVCPTICLTLIEATGKKVAFLRHIIATLGLEDVTVLHARAEEVGQMPDHRERYDWVLARAVAGMRTLVEYLLPLCRIGGHCLAWKGENAPQEVSGAQQAISLLGGQVVQLIPVELPMVAETHYLVDVVKMAATPPKYPRRPGMPAKRPL